MTRSDKLLTVFIVLWLAIAATFWLAHLHIWSFLWLGILALVGLAELVSKLTTGRTISQKFVAWEAQRPWQARGLLVVMGLAWLMLLAHLWR